jgi:hypothetical protein
MRKGILITLPESDDVTTYLSAFSKEIIYAAKENQIEIKTLEKEEATKENFTKIINKLDYKMVIFNGHGSPDKICGHKNKEIISLGVNEQLIRNRITYARSCWALSELGSRCTTGSKGCFIGYKIPFMFMSNINWTTNPIKDNTAKVFFDTTNLVPIGLIKGHNAEEVDQNSKKSMLKSINKALIEGSKDSQAIAQVLWNNYVGQGIAGNEQERLY